MIKRLLISGLAVLTATAAAPPVRTMYDTALAREKAVRPALAAPDPAPTVLEEIRAVVARYEAVVRRYPASSYCDNALWQAAQLALDAYARFHQPEDRSTGLRLLRRLPAMYPTSRLAKQVPQTLARYDDSAVDKTAEPVGSSGASPTSAAARPSGPARPEPTRTGERSGVAIIKDIHRTVLPDAVRVVIELDGEVEFSQDRIPDPSRVFVDLSTTRAGATLVDHTLRFEGDADIVRQIRIGKHPNNVTRVVLDAAGVSTYSVYPLYDPFRLVIDCVRAAGPIVTPPAVITVADAPALPSPAPVRRDPAPLPSRPAITTWLRSAPSNLPQHGVMLINAHRTPAEAEPAAATAAAAPTATAPGAPAAPAAKNGNGSYSIARQLGLGVSRIVIDAGHGGHDPGARARGVVESELVLDIALRLEKLLQKLPGVDVVLTRRSDDFIALQERTAIANREGADLFLSIHANASPSAQTGGIETYFLNFASNLSAAAVAARENAASGQSMAALPDIVKAIALNNKLDESRDFASEVQRAMLEHLRTSNRAIKDLGVKQAPFVVLIGAAMPSVLAEISFITNPQEARLLKSSGYRQKIADALFNAIKRYQTSLKKLNAVVSQQ